MDIHSLDRFLAAQDDMYAIALREIKNGKKNSHWIWYIFPQLRGLGKSQPSYEYGISGYEEAKAYLAHPILSARLVEISEALLEHAGRDIVEILGHTDAMKLRSSMTLFAIVSDPDSVFHRVLNCFYGGKPDIHTIHLAR